MALDKIGADGIGNNVVALHHCDWYTDATGLDAGALKLPVGTTSERPTVVVGGREDVSFDLHVTNDDTVAGDPGFNQNDPWQWTWEANYNRPTAATNVTDTSSLIFFRGSKYTFKNYTLGHGLYIRHTEKTSAGQANDFAVITTGITGTQGVKKASVGASPGTIIFDIPTDYAYNQVVIQHAQTGMANVITVTDPPTESLGYIRLNTSKLTGADPTTGTVLEYYTGRGWSIVGVDSSSGKIIAHPTGTFDPAEDWNSDSGTYDWNSGTGSEDWGPAQVTAFGAAGDISQNADKALVAHDGSTGGGIPMLRADMSNLPNNLVNTKYSFYRSNNETLTECTTQAASKNNRLSFDNAIEVGVPNIVLSDSNRLFTINKEVSNSYFKFEIKIKPSADCTLQVWKNGSHIANSDYVLDANYHSTVSWIESASFNDNFHFRLYSTGIQSISVTDKDTLLIEFIGS